MTAHHKTGNVIAFPRPDNISQHHAQIEALQIRIAALEARQAGLRKPKYRSLLNRIRAARKRLEDRA